MGGNCRPGMCVARRGLQTGAERPTPRSERREDRRAERAKVDGVRPGGRVSRPARRHARARAGIQQAARRPRRTSTTCCRSPTRTARPIKGSWVLDDEGDDEGRVLRFPHVEASRDYIVTIPAALTAADGRTLGQDVRRTVHTGPLDPVVGFASQGSVLPARESRGLPVVSVNVPKSTSNSCASRTRRMPRFFAEFQRGGRRGTWDLEREYSWDDETGEEHSPHAAVATRRTGLRQPLRPRRQDQRTRADLPAVAGHPRVAVARPVFRGDEARGHVHR